MGRQSEGVWIVHDHYTDTRMFVSRDWILQRHKEGQVTGVPEEVIPKIAKEKQVIPEIPESAKHPTSAFTYVKSEESGYYPVKEFKRQPVKTETETVTILGRNKLGGIVIKHKDGRIETLPPKRLGFSEQEVKQLPEYKRGVEPQRYKGKVERFGADAEAQYYKIIEGKEIPISKAEYDRLEKLRQQEQDLDREARMRVARPETTLAYGLLNPIEALGGLLGAGYSFLDPNISLSEVKMIEYQKRKEWVKGMLREESVPKAMTMPLVKGGAEWVILTAPYGKIGSAVSSKVASTSARAFLKTATTTAGLGMTAYGTKEIIVGRKMIAEGEKKKGLEKVTTGGMVAVAGAGITRAGWKMPLIKQPAYQEFVALSTTEARVKGHMGRLPDSHVYHRPRVEKYTEVIPKKEILRISKHGKVVKETPDFMLKRLGDTEMLIAKKPTGMQTQKMSDLVDVFRTESQYGGRFHGMDVFVRKGAKMPITYKKTDTYVPEGIIRSRKGISRGFLPQTKTLPQPERLTPNMLDTFIKTPVLLPQQTSRIIPLIIFPSSKADVLIPQTSQTKIQKPLQPMKQEPIYRPTPPTPIPKPPEPVVIPKPAVSEQLLPKQDTPPIQETFLKPQQTSITKTSLTTTFIPTEISVPKTVVKTKTGFVTPVLEFPSITSDSSSLKTQLTPKKKKYAHSLTALHFNITSPKVESGSLSGFEIRPMKKRKKRKKR